MNFAFYTKNVTGSAAVQIGQPPRQGSPYQRVQGEPFRHRPVRKVFGLLSFRFQIRLTCELPLAGVAKAILRAVALFAVAC